MIRVQAQHLQLGDVVGSGELVESVSAGTRTPRGKVEIGLAKAGKFRIGVWGKTTMIGVQDRKVAQ